MKSSLLVVLFLAFLSQLLLVPLYKVGPAGPDFVLLVLSYAALLDRPRRSLSLAFFSGLLADALSADPWGAHAAGYAAAAFLLGRWGRDGWAGERLARFFLLTAGLLAAGGVRLGALSLLKDSRPVFELQALLLGTLYNASLSLLVFGLLDPFRARLFSVPRRFLTVPTS
jgi:rod shape-determining protein MreD